MRDELTDELMVMAAMKILIVEDDAFKLERISNCLKRVAKPPALTVAMSVQSAVATLSAQRFDVVLLDMALPSHEVRPGGAPPSSLLSGGMEIIMELDFLKRAEKVTVITQYPEIEIEGELIPVERSEAALKRMCAVNFAGVIHYKHDEKEWETVLIQTLGL